MDHPAVGNGVLNITRGRSSVAFIFLVFGLAFFGLGIAGVTGMIPAEGWHSGHTQATPSAEALYIFLVVGGLTTLAALWHFIYRDEVALDFNQRRFVRRKGLGVREGSCQSGEHICVKGSRLSSPGTRGVTHSIILVWQNPSDQCVLEVMRVGRDDQFVLRFANAYAQGLGLPLDDQRTP